MLLSRGKPVATGGVLVLLSRDKPAATGGVSMLLSRRFYLGVNPLLRVWCFGAVVAMRLSRGKPAVTRLGFSILHCTMST
ncbi:MULTISPECIES: hypothetical protein [unclassified Pseudoalteromonas]|uniref:hypothetical protein n=1 Tax=unclassified Pseudoalteromonas TaxID=194690 RepID=UPI001F3BE3FF|nr:MULTISPECIES: hypothetical protein [unclassified Pseudoalteromonas]MCF2833654.1 hypothetical protein [Pseudoalteromonas sp. DL2-H6]MCF2927251.1 hypothetical protein [Pseudoalteromonas sp. DL2-H1]